MMRFLSLFYCLTLYSLLSTSLVFAAVEEAPPSTSLALDSVDISNQSIYVTIGDSQEVLSHDIYRAWIESTPYTAYSSIPVVQDILRTDYCIAFQAPCSLRGSVRDESHIIKVESRMVNASLASDYLEDLSEKLLRQPVNAVLGAQGNEVVALNPDLDGLTVSTESNATLLAAAIVNQKSSAVMQTSPAPATVTSENFKDVLGLREVIGEGRSDFAGSTPSRIHNIRTAAARFDNMIVAPGDEFSFVANLGAVNGSTGYKKELVIKNNQTIPEYGGGVCQVSTTIFRGAILTGMEITERRNHSYPVKYYKPYGFDATIYLPAPDIKFKNNTQNHIMISSRMDGTELVFTYYGTKDGREVVMDGPHITEKNPDGSMKTNFTQRVTDVNGAVVVEKTFYSNYKSPDAYPLAGDTSIGGSKLTSKPKDWSKKQWKAYEQANGL